MDRSRRDIGKCSLAMLVAFAVGLAPGHAKAFVGLLRLLFAIGARRGGAAALGRSAAALGRGAIGRAAALPVTRRAIVSRTGAATVSRNASRAPFPSTRISSRLQPARRQAPTTAASAGAARLTPASLRTPVAAGGHGLVDLAMIARDFTGSLDGGHLPDPLQVQGPVEVVEIEIEGFNNAQQPLNGVLSVLMFDQAFADGADGLYAREVLGVIDARPGDQLKFVHEIEVSGIPAGAWYVVPTVTALDTDVDLELFAFEPSSVVVELA